MLIYIISDCVIPLLWNYPKRSFTQTQWISLHTTVENWNQPQIFISLNKGIVKYIMIYPQCGVPCCYYVTNNPYILPHSVRWEKKTTPNRNGMKPISKKYHVHREGAEERLLSQEWGQRRDRKSEFAGFLQDLHVSLISMHFFCKLTLKTCFKYSTLVP